MNDNEKDDFYKPKHFIENFSLFCAYPYKEGYILKKEEEQNQDTGDKEK